MSQELFRRIEELYFELEELDQAQRESHLEGLRNREPAVAEHLEKLLQASTTEILPFDAPPDDGPDNDGNATVPTNLEQQSPSRFRLIRKLGEGGMGTVHEAEQLAPVQRRVAIKLIRSAMASKRSIARFEAERQALAALNHAHIAQVYEAGADLDGRLFIAMELVHGEPITVYCDSHRLNTRQRIELFEQVCAGVAHAHRAGIIHRDLKPSNIMVEEFDGRAAVKIIDFGIAKAVTPVLQTDTDLKHRAMPIGTPEYMSPEQFLNGQVDTRSDVYALGVLLFELLVGQLPISGQVLRRRSLEEIRRQIRDSPTPTPSSRVDTTTDFAQATAKQRSTAPTALARQLRGELDWIVLKALAKEPDLRYESVPDLATDLHNFLEHRPVNAGPSTRTYRATRWIRRNRGQTAAASAVIAALIAGVIGMAVGLDRANRSEQRAEREAAVSGEVVEFLRGVLSSGAQALEQGREPSVRELFVQAQARVQESPPEDPLVLGTLLNRIADFHFLDLQDYSTAEGIYREAETVLRSSELNGKELANTLLMLATNERVRGRLDQASSLLEESLLLSRNDADGPDASVLEEMALVARRRGELGRALELMREAVGIKLEQEGQGSETVLGTKLNLAGVLLELERRDEARAVNEEVLRNTQEKGLALYQSVALNNLGHLANLEGDLNAASQYFDQATAILRDRLDSDPVRLEIQVSNTGMIFAKRGDYSEAAVRLSEALELAEQSTGKDGSSAASLRVLLGEIELRAANPAKARTYLQRAIAIYEVTEPEHPTVSVLRAKRLLAMVDEAEGKPLVARIRLEQTLAGTSEELRNFDPEGECLLRLELARLRADEGSEPFGQAQRICEGSAVWTNERILYSRATALLAQNRTSEALSALEELAATTSSLDAWPAIDPAFAPLREDARFRSAIEKITPQ